MAGRPRAYKEETAKEIIRRMCEGESLRAICSDEHMPARATVMMWVAENENGFLDRYEKACIARAHFWADELLDIADDGSNDWMEKYDKDGGAIGWRENGEALQRSRLRVDSRKWLLSKMLPRYADKQTFEHSGPNGDPIKTESKVEWTIQPVKPINEADS